MITVKIKDGCRRPYLSTDQNHIRADTTRLLGEHLRQVSKNPTSGLGGHAITRKSLRTDGRTYRWMPDGPLWDKLYLSVVTL